MPELDQLIQLATGPAGAIAVLVVIVTLFATDRLNSKGRLDDEKAARSEATSGWREQSAATSEQAKANDRMAAALEERNRLDREFLAKHQ